MNKTLLSSLLFAGVLAIGPALAQDAGTEAEAAVVGQGEADISSALADAMVESGAATDTEAALATLAEMRAEGMGWGQIAQELGFNLGEVVSAAARAGAIGKSQGEAGLAVADENRARGDADGDDEASADANAGAATAASARTQADVGRGISTDARANTGLRGSISGRPVGAGAPVLPQRVERPAAVERPATPSRPGRP